MGIDWNATLELVKALAQYLFVPVVIALVKSERLALDNSTQANGITHWYRLACKALATIPPEDIKVMEAKLESVAPEAAGIIDALTNSMDQKEETKP